MEKQNKKKDWCLDSALEYYGIPNWGSGYFGINEKGNLCVHPYGQPGPTIDILDVIDEIKDKNLSLPCVVRFQDILRSRVEKLIGSFKKYIQEYSYTGDYFGVYPIKVNQMREVVEEILDASRPYHFGLEAGSKAELMAVLSNNDDLEALTICNGHKDEDFLRLALMGRKLGRKVVVVIEKVSELLEIIRISDEMKIEPMLGFRARLSTSGAGKWNGSAGDFAKFGLTTPEIIQAVDYLTKINKKDCFKLFHFHIGSQLTDIKTIKEAVMEAARLYAKLYKMGCPIEYLDVGGGLAVDYQGAKTTTHSSKNYTLDEYVADVVWGVQDICKSEKVPEPHLVSESGRAITAHHSCILMNVFGNIEVGNQSLDLIKTENESATVKDMKDLIASLKTKNIQEVYHDATDVKEQALAKFRLGILSLEERAQIEALYWNLCRKLTKISTKLKRVPEDIRELDEKMADQYLVNFSVFQSAPDHWAIDQLFPILPLHRFHEEPTKEGVLVDITCDSDGRIDDFIHPEEVQHSLRLHELKPGEPYYLGMFLLGAYQDIMGDMHNLFGRAHEVHVFCDDEDPEDFYIEEVIAGESIKDALKLHQYHANDLVRDMKKAIDVKIKSGDIKPKEGMQMVDFYEQVLNSYTYLRINQ